MEIKNPNEKGEIITSDMLRKHSEAPSDEAIAGQSHYRPVSPGQ